MTWWDPRYPGRRQNRTVTLPESTLPATTDATTPPVGGTVAALDLDAALSFSGSLTSLKAGGYPETVMADGPVMYLRLDETSGTNANDQTANNNDGTYQTGVTLGGTGAIAGNASADFNGTTGFVSVAHAASLNLADGPLSIEAWVRRDVSDTLYHGIVDKGTNAYFFHIKPSNHATAPSKVAFGKTLGSTVCFSNVAITDTAWHHVVVTYNTGTTGRIYIDGVEGTTQGVTQVIANTADVLSLAKDVGNSGFFNGSMDEIAIYNTVLSQARITAHYDARTGAGGSPGPTTLSSLSGALSFSGSLDATRVAPVTGGTNAEMSIIVAATNASTQSKAQAHYQCDGTADQTEINAAIAALPANIGGTVLLTEGDFRISSSIVMNKSGVTLRGSANGNWAGFGPAGGGTRLRFATGLTGQLIDVRRTDASLPVGNVTLADFLIDGAATDADGGTNRGGTAVDGIMFRAFESIIDSVRVKRMSGHGIRIKGYSPSDPNGRWATYDTHVVNCSVSHNTGSGIFSDDYGEDLQLAIITTHTNDEDGFRIQGSSCQIIDSHSYSNGRYGINIASGAARVKAVACKIEHAKQHGIYNAGSMSIISGCNVHINGQLTNATYANIYSIGGDMLVSGCGIGWDTGEGGNRPNIGIQAPSGNGIISGCMFTGSYPGGNVSLGASVKLRACNIADVN